MTTSIIRQDLTARIYVVVHCGMVGSAIVRQLLSDGVPAQNIISRTYAKFGPTDQIYLVAASPVTDMLP